MEEIAGGHPFDVVPSTSSNAEPIIACPNSNLTLCDYFAVVGFDKPAGLQVDKFAELASELAGPSSSAHYATSDGNPSSPPSKSPLDRAYQAKVLAHFPNQREGFPFAYEAASLCMPKGLKFYTERKVPKEPNFHSFVIIREDGSRINGCALIFYEELLDNDIRQQIYNLQMEHVRQMAISATSSSNSLSGADPNNPGEDNNRSSTQPQTDQYGREKQHHPPGQVTFGNHTLPRKQTSRRGRSSSNKNKRVSYYDSVTKPIYVSKCLCLITRIPIVYSSENLLRHLWSRCQPSADEGFLSRLPVESLIYWALREVPLPVPGTCLNISFGSCQLVVKRPLSTSNELPFFDYPIQSLFTYIEVPKFLVLFTCFLLEHQILLCSKYMDRLMLVAECLSALVFPFKWQLTYVPILPYSQLKFIEAPVPYVMGLCYDEKIPDQIFQSNVCIFDIDHGRLDHPEDIPHLPRQRQIATEITHILQRFRPAQPKAQTPPAFKQTVVETQHPPVEDPNKPVIVMRRSRNKDQNKAVQNRSGDLWAMKRMSRSFENNLDLDAFAAEIQAEIDQHEPTPPSQSSNENYGSANKMAEVLSPSQSGSSTAYLRGLRFNQAIRELFLHHFSSLFTYYENFLLGNGTNGHMENNRESMVNFDKASFLSDQPDSYLPFLAAFLETQMFTSFIDSKILSQCPLLQNKASCENNDDSHVVYFDRKICSLQQETVANTGGSARTPDRQPLDFLSFPSIASVLQQQNEQQQECDGLTADYEVPVPHLLEVKEKLEEVASYNGIFPDLDPKLFEVEEERSSKVAPGNSVLCSPWKQQHHNRIAGKKQRVLSVLEDAANRLAPNNNPTSIESPMKVAHQNWKFVEQLLKETKTKTKRMLVAKMGKEAVHLGHGDLGITGMEENTLVAGFCDLLERVWAHGLKKKQGKSALWANIFAHHDREKFDNLKPVDRYSTLSPAYNFLPPLSGRKEQILSTLSQNEGDLNVLPTKHRLTTKPQQQPALEPGTEDSAKTLSDLLDSIRNIAKSLEVMPFEVDKKEVREKTTESNNLLDSENRPVNSTSGKIQTNSTVIQTATNTNWSNSLFKAANFICDKVTDKITPIPEARRPSWILGPFMGDAERKKGGEEEQQLEVKTVEVQRPRDDSRARFYHHQTELEKRDLNGNLNRSGRRTGRLREARESRQNNRNNNHNNRAENSTRPEEKPVDELEKLGRHIGSLSQGMMRKSSSVSDFAPHWSTNALSTIDHGNNPDSNQPPRPSHRHARDGSLSAREGLPQHGQARNGGRRSLSRPRSPASSGPSRRRGSGTGIDLERNLAPLPTRMAYDLKNVMRMTEIKTDIGFARAFVRLALERKLLHKHLKSVLSNTHLLQKMYKRYAFLRCEDEREQFLYHVLSLNAVDFSCFTHTFISTKIHYEVLLVASIDRFCSSSIWVMLTGSLGSTTNIFLPSNTLQFTFDYKNLGILSTLRIGQSVESGKKGAHPSKWFLEYILVRNNITAQTFSFHCGRWFGRGVEDGALERLLVAERFSATGNREDTIDSELMDMESSFYSSASMANGGSGFDFKSFISRPESPVSGVNILGSPSTQKPNYYYSNTGSLARRRRSPSVGRSSLTEYYGSAKQSAPRITEIQHKLGVSVNALVKHFFTDKDYRSGARLTPLLCGENGLVSSLEQVFELGRQDTLFSNRFFRQPYPWDYIEKVFSWFANFFRNGESRKLTKEQRSLIIYVYNLVAKISANTAVGKEGKFHIFVLLTLREHALPGLLPLMAWTPVTQQMYDESAFLRQPHHLSNLSKLLNSLNDFHFTLERSLTYGIEL